MALGTFLIKRCDQIDVEQEGKDKNPSYVKKI